MSVPSAAGGSAQAGPRSPATPSGPSVSSGGNKLSISLSAIVASLWAGIWGFDWAATHLGSGALLLAVLVSLAIGAAITYYIARETFATVREFERWQHEARMEQLRIEKYRAEHNQPAGGDGDRDDSTAEVTEAAPPEVVSGPKIVSPPAKDRQK
jgi:hypothetical protein